MSRVSSFFGLEGTKDAALRLMKIYAALGFVIVFITTLSSTFYIIFVAEIIGGGSFIEGMALVSILLVIEMGVQTLLDYPTGVIGDWVGQRYILASSYLTYALAFFMVSLITSETPFIFLIVLYAMMGFAASQNSGALSSWFDNNYRRAASDDKDRTQYGVFLGRNSMLSWIANTVAIIPGGLLAVILSRPWVFQAQAVLFILIALSSLWLVTDLPDEGVADDDSHKEKEPYFTLLKGGLKYLFSSPFVTYLILGLMLVNSGISIWGSMILFPIYYTYLISDVAVASVRTIIKTPYVIFAERSGVWAKRFEPKTWIPRFAFLSTCGVLFFWAFSLIILVFPPPPAGSSMIEIMLPFTDILVLQVPVDSLLPTAIMIVTFFLTAAFLQIRNVLVQRVLIDVIPNRVRNGMYSLFPTILLLFTIPQLIVFGWLIQEVGIPPTLVLMGLVSLLGVLIMRRGLNSAPKQDFLE